MAATSASMGPFPSPMTVRGSPSTRSWAVTVVRRPPVVTSLPRRRRPASSGR